MGYDEHGRLMALLFRALGPTPKGPAHPAQFGASRSVKASDETVAGRSHPSSCHNTYLNTMSQPSDTRPPDSGLTDEKQYDYGDYYHSANKRPRPDDDAEGSRGHPSHVSHQHPGHSIHPPAQQSPSTPISGPKRASQACLRCRKQKLRCLGGYPCSRCVK